MPEQAKGLLSSDFLRAAANMTRPHVTISDTEDGYLFRFEENGYHFFEKFEKVSDEWMLHFIALRIYSTKSVMRRHIMCQAVGELQKKLHLAE